MADKTGEIDTPAPKARRGGLVMPANPGRALQELMQQEGREGGSAAVTTSRDISGSTPSARDDARNITSNIESNISASITDSAVSSVAAQVPDSLTASEETSEVRQAVRRAGENLPASEAAPAQRQPPARAEAKKPARKEAKAVTEASASLERVRDLGQSAAIPITLRLAEGLNDAIDDVAHRYRKPWGVRKTGVKKQDLITLAVQMLVAELESGADLGDLLDTYQGGGGR